MAFEKAKAYLEGFGLGDKIIVTEHSSATVAEAAQAIGCEEAMIAKTLSFLQEDGDRVCAVNHGNTQRLICCISTASAHD